MPKLSFKALITLFDSLIKPILLYGAPIWTPNISINKSLLNALETDNDNSANFLKSISRSVQEKVHLSYLKWALGVHRKASNIGVWGESGRYPLIYQSIRLTLNYFKRILGGGCHEEFWSIPLKKANSSCSKIIFEEFEMNSSYSSIKISRKCVNIIY